MKKILIIVLIMMVIPLIFLTACGPAPLSEEQIETIFERDYELLFAVVSYLKNSDLNEVFIVYWTQDIEKITDAEIVEAIYTLKTLGFRSIGKRENTIRFQSFPQSGGLIRGSGFMSGIAYSIDGREPTGINFLTRLEPLSAPNWYYYEDDYNEWRDRNRR